MSEEKEKTKIEPGTHKVKVRNWGLRETKSGKLQVYIGFSNGATFFQMVGVNETGDEILARALTVCGFAGKDLPDLFGDDALDKEKEIEIFIKYSPNRETGEEQMQVYVNDPSKSMKGSLDKKEALKKLKELNISLGKDLKLAQSEIGTEKRSKSKPETKPETQKFDEDDIPF